MTRHGFGHVTFVSAGAGSGKTYRLTQELERALVDDDVDPAGVIATTFTVKAAGELNDRVRERLIGAGQLTLAERMSQALIGTVHSVCERLLNRFAFELGLSPQLNVLGVEDDRLFRQALDRVVDLAGVQTMNALARRLSIGVWQDDVKAIADRARDNAIAASALPAMAAASADALLVHFPPPQPDNYLSALRRAVARALESIDIAADGTKTTARYVDMLRRALHALCDPDCAWTEWIGLSVEAPARASDAAGALVRGAAQCFAQHPEFHRDVRTYIGRCYAIAADTLTAYQDLKTRRGVIDFTDMESRMLEALDHPAVAARLADEVELLLVDEFQDTNPMQLALFAKLARFARRVIFVGDVKQAVYAFRGCDPELVATSLRDLTARGARSDVLQSSWRARPALLGYLNQLFGKAFAEDGMTAADVALAPERSECGDAPAVMSWRLAGPKAARDQALAGGVSALVAECLQVADPQTGVLRDVRYGDIAVLARTNDHVEAIALALKAKRVPIKMTLRGLLEVPEVCFARACLRRLTDSTDTLATAEIVALADGAPAESWLADRLRAAAAGEAPWQWLEASHPIVRRLAELREDLKFQSPLETVVRVLNDVGIREIVCAWGPDALKAAQRQRNLDAFLDLVVEYETYSASVHDAATLTGFLFWLMEPHSPDLDLQPTVTTGDAVHVLTYHKAKGLEWPVVIAADFNVDVQTDLWRVRVLPTGDFDIESPLENRAIRFWPRVFGDRRRGIAILDAIEASVEAQQSARTVAAEQRRLAYVGMTRARDLVVIALPESAPRPAAWWQTFGDDTALPVADEFMLDDATPVPSRAATLIADDHTAATAPRFTPSWFPSRDRVARPRKIVSPSQAPPRDDACVVAEFDLGSRIAVGGDDMNLIGRALHAVIAAELVNPARDGAIETTSALLAGFGAVGALDAAASLAVAQRFERFVRAQFAATRIAVEYPVQHRTDDGRKVHGWIDVLLETADGLIVIDHKSSPRPRSEWRTEALEHSGQLAAYRAALEACGERVAACGIHFPVSGGLVLVD